MTVAGPLKYLTLPAISKHTATVIFIHVRVVSCLLDLLLGASTDIVLTRLHLLRA